MAGTAVTPTRMVLNQLKGRLKTARRGHKLLKDKRDELMRQFMDVVKENKILRERVEEGLTGAFASLQVASAIMSPEMLEQALLYPRQSVELEMKYKNIMSVNVPQYSFKTRNNDPSEIYPYGFAQWGQQDYRSESHLQEGRDNDFACNGPVSEEALRGIRNHPHPSPRPHGRTRPPALRLQR